MVALASSWHRRAVRTQPPSHDPKHVPSLPPTQVLQGMYNRETGEVDKRWVAFMEYQIERAQVYFKESEAGVNHLDANARYPVW